MIKFLNRFQLSSDQRDCLNECNLPNNLSDFLRALKRCEEIYQDCSRMLNEDGSLHSACIPILEDISSIRETGLKRLYSYTQQVCQSLNTEKSLLPENINNLRLSLYYLSLRPIFLEHCKESIVHSRRGDLSRKFIIALTRGSPNSGYKPIELNAHDPIRYIGDMFAWIHQSVASEKELISNLWSLIIPNTSDSDNNNNETTTSDSSANNNSNGENEKEKNEEKDILGAIIGGLSKTFHIRVEQILMNTFNTISAYKIYQVLIFYRGTLYPLLPTEGLISTIDTLIQSAESKLEECVSSNVLQITSGPAPYPVDLAPLHSVTDLVGQITQLLNLYEQSSINDPSSFSIKKILDIVVNPIKELFERASQGLDSLDKYVFIVNSLDSLSNSLSVYECTSEYVQDLRSELEDYMDRLVSDQTAVLIKECGLDHVLLGLQTKSADTPLSATQHGKYEEVYTSIKQLTSMLFSPLLPQFDLLTAKLRNQGRNQVFQNICKIYEKLYNAVHDPANQYDDPDSIFLHTPDQVRALLDCD